MPSTVGDLATAALALGHSFKEQGKLAEAQICYEQVVALREGAFGAQDASLVEPLRDLAFVCQAQDALPDAERHTRRLVALFETVQGADYDGEGLHQLAGLCGAQGRATEGEQLLLKAVALKEKRLGPDHFDVAMRLGDLCVLYEAQGRLMLAKTLRERMIVIVAREWGPFDPQVAALLETLASLCERLGMAEDTARHRRTLAEIRAQQGKPRN